MSLPINPKNPNEALASVKIGTYNFFSQNNDLMDIIVITENENKEKKDYTAIADSSLEIDPSEDDES
jgi:hypothetical protein